MKKITVRLSTLMEILTQMKHDNVDFVEMDLVGDAVDCGPDLSGVCRTTGRPENLRRVHCRLRLRG